MNITLQSSVLTGVGALCYRDTKSA